MKTFLGHRSLSVIFVLGLSTIPACGSDSDPVVETPDSSLSVGQEVCASATTFVSACKPASECESSISGDCAGVAALMSFDSLQSSQECLKTGGSPAACFGAAPSTFVPSTAQKEFASTFCAMCAPTVTGCEDAFFSSSSSSGELKGAGSLVMPFNDTIVSDMKSLCTTGQKCLDNFPTCSQKVLANHGVSNRTANCLISNLKNGTGRQKGCQSAWPGAGGSGTGGSGGTTGTGGNAGTAGDAGSGGVSGGGSGGSSGSGGANVGGAGGSQGGSGGATGGSAGTSTGGTGGTGGSSCTEFDKEPNNDQSKAQDIGTITDCDDGSVMTQGTVAGSSDHDWYKVAAQDASTCFNSPTFSFSSTVMTTVCAYFRCNNDKTTLVTCPDNNTAATAPGGELGCCQTAVNGTVSPQVNCNWSSDDSSQVWIEVYSKAAPGCVQYSVKSAY